MQIVGPPRLSKTGWSSVANFDRNEVDYIREQHNISDVIGRFVTWDRKKSKPAKGDWWACCPFHGEKSPSFHCEDAKGRYHCFGCGASGDHFKFLMDYRGLSFPQALEELGGERREMTPEEKQEWAEKQRQLEAQRAEREQQQLDDQQSRVMNARNLWGSCKSFGDTIQGTLAETYLMRRGIPQISWPLSLRFHGSLFCEVDEQQHPCLVAAVSNLDRKIIAVWRIFLADDGANLVLDGDKVKRGYGPSSGGVVRLTPLGPEHNSGEGLESTLGAYMLAGQRGSWDATLSTSGMQGAAIPKMGFHRIWSDGDRSRLNPETGELQEAPGMRAALAMKQNSEQAGNQVTIMEPPEGSDWLDVWQSRGEHYG